MGNALRKNRSHEPKFEDYIKLSDLNKPIEFRYDQEVNLGPTIKEGEVNMMSKRFYNSIIKDKLKFKEKSVVGAFINAPIFVGTFSVVIDFAVIKDMDCYRDEEMDDIIVGKSFARKLVSRQNDWKE
nr:hypothetical protein [Tanacetum cinerariifolium]